MNSPTTETVSADGVSDHAAERLAALAVLGPLMLTVNADGVSADAGQRSARQDQNQAAQARRRARRRLRLVTRRLVVESEWLDTLEERGYLDPDDRGDGPAEVKALGTFLSDHLG